MWKWGIGTLAAMSSEVGWTRDVSFSPKKYVPPAYVRVKSVMSSAAEAELGALFINAKLAIPMRHTLEEMGHPQGKTPIQTDNSMAHGVVNGKIQPKQTKAMDMRYYWLKDRETQNFFQFHWKPSKNNLADYWTKHHAAIHHTNIRSQILSRPSVITQLRNRLTKALKHAAARVC
jgi:hypothetical protein